MNRNVHIRVVGACETSATPKQKTESLITEDPIYRDPYWLTVQYYVRERSITDIADQLGLDHTTISKWRRKLNIPKPDATVDLECPVCGDSFTRAESKVERTSHASVCSRECHYEGRSQGIIGREVEDGYDVSPTVLARTCPTCGENFTTTLSEDHKYCSRECFLSAHSERMEGTGNPSYIDGSSKNKRSWRGPHWKSTRKEVYERDNYTCQRCGQKCIPRSAYDGTNGGKIIQAHHIEGFENPEDNTLENLVTLCASCHAKVEHGSAEIQPVT